MFHPLLPPWTASETPRESLFFCFEQRFPPSPASLTFYELHACDVIDQAFSFLHGRIKSIENRVKANAAPALDSRIRDNKEVFDQEVRVNIRLSCKAKLVPTRDTLLWFSSSYCWCRSQEIPLNEVEIWVTFVTRL